MKGKKIKQINNWTIYYTELQQYAVYNPAGICIEDRLTLQQAEEFCRQNLDYVTKRGQF